MQLGGAAGGSLGAAETAAAACSSFAAAWCHVPPAQILLLGCLPAWLPGCLYWCRYAARWRVASYGDLVLQHFGRPGAALLQLAIAVHVMGVMISYNGGWA